MTIDQLMNCSPPKKKWMNENKDLELIIPEGMTKDEVLTIIETVINKIAFKYSFGSYVLEDIKQEARIIAVDGLKRYDNKRPLENFLYIHVKNRLYNFKRDNYIRPIEKCKNCDDNSCSRCLKKRKFNTAKQNLAYSVDYTNSTSEVCFDLSEMELKEFREQIDRTLPLELRADYIRMINGVTISHVKKKEIMKFVIELLYT